MKNRTNEIWESLSDLIEERGLNDISQTFTSFNEHSEHILADLSSALISCEEQAAARRQSGEKGETTYISLSFLDSSILTGAFDMRIDFYDEGFITDIAEASAYFSYAHLIPYYRESADIICTKAGEQFVRLMGYERDALAWKYKDEVLYKMVMTTCSLGLLHPDMRSVWSKLAVSDNCVFTFGRLLNDQQLYLNYPHTTEAVAS
jgi:hypothetical protein